MKEIKLGNFTIKDINGAVIICVAFCLVSLGYLVFLIFQADFYVLPFLTIPLICGLITENKRLSDHWTFFVIKLMFAFILSSFLVFIINLDSFNAAEQIRNWPYIFIVIFAFISAIFYEKKVTPRITEGVTLLQSIAVIYLVLQTGFFIGSNYFMISALGIGIVFIVFSFYNAFSSHRLTKRTRLILSVWSSIVMSIFSLVYIYRVYHFQYFTGIYSIDYFINILQHFLLGISLVYIIQNLRMVAVYVPSKNSFFDKDHLTRIARMNKLHIGRFSLEQVRIKDSLLLSMVSVVVFSANYIFNFLPELTLIWIVFWTAPFLIAIKDRVSIKAARERNSSKPVVPNSSPGMNP